MYLPTVAATSRIVDDEPETLLPLCRTFTFADYDIVLVSGADEALATIVADPPNVVLLRGGNLLPVATG